MEQDTETTQTTSRSVLIVDDDRFLLDMYGLKFTKSGFAVRSCVSVDEALDVLRSGLQPDAIVFDLIMPQKDGREFLRTVEQEGLAKGAARIALTNQSSDRDRLETEDIGVDKYVVKATMVPSEVVNTVSDVIRSKRRA